MAFSRDGLYQIGPGGNGPRLWMYNTADTIATVNTADYFVVDSESIPELQLNDVIIVVSSTGGTPVVTITYVNAYSSTSCDVVDGLTVTATDSD